MSDVYYDPGDDHVAFCYENGSIEFRARPFDLDPADDLPTFDLDNEK